MVRYHCFLPASPAVFSREPRMPLEWWQPGKDSNLDKRNQNPLSYRLNDRATQTPAHSLPAPPHPSTQEVTA